MYELYGGIRQLDYAIVWSSKDLLLWKSKDTSLGISEQSGWRHFTNCSESSIWFCSGHNQVNMIFSIQKRNVSGTVNLIYFLSALATYDPGSHRKLLSSCPTWCWLEWLHTPNALHDLEIRCWPAFHMPSEEARTHQLGSLEDDRRGPVHHQKLSHLFLEG